MIYKTKITTVGQAEAFFKKLARDNLVFHPEDKAEDCIAGLVSATVLKQIQARVNECWALNMNVFEIALTAEDGT